MTKDAPENKNAGGSLLMRVVVVLAKSVLPLVILVAGAGAVFGMMKTAPQAKKGGHPRQAKLVTVIEAQQLSVPIEIEAWGTVMAAREVTLNPQVAGEIVEISPSMEPGGRFQKGETLVRIEATDYELTREMRRAELTQMEAKRVLERANQEVAKREYEVLGESLDDEEKSLVLREPQLTSASAEVSAARAMLNDADLDLKRTEVNAPFDAQVVEKYVDLGTRLTTQMGIVRLVGTDTYWVELAVPQSDLRWIQFPEGDQPGSRVVFRHKKIWGPEPSRDGQVIRLLPELSAEGSMVRVLVAVDDPLCLKAENQDKPRLLVGQYLSGVIAGRQLDNVFVVDRSLLRNGDWVWVMNSENKLEVRALEVAYRGDREVIVRSGIAHGERVISTDIATVAEGMELRVEEPLPEADEVVPPSEKAEATS